MIFSVYTLYSTGSQIFNLDLVKTYKQKNVFKFHPVRKNLMSPHFENQSLRKEFTVFPANSQSEAIPIFIAVILSLFLCLFLKREANMTYSVYTLYSIGWADFHQPNLIQ